MRICANPYCADEIADQRPGFRLCPSCWFMARTGVTIGAGLLMAIGFGVSVVTWLIRHG